MMIRAGVYGASGYAGLDLVEILLAHPEVDLIFATSNTYAGERVPGSDMAFVRPDSVSLDDVDVIFLALPPKASAGAAKLGMDAGV